MTRSILPRFTLAAALALPGIALAKAAEGGSLICGGVGADERRAMAGESEGANLLLENLTAGGAYVADVDVVLSPERAGDPGFAFKAEGPLCYLQVPAGSYRIEATHEGKRRTTRAQVAESPEKPAHVTLAFPETRTANP
jgi:hypothetical protein